jgi:hypothetical protein
VRTGDTVAACGAAAWNGPYATPTGSDISALTAAKYIQFKCQLYTKVVADSALVYLYRGAAPNDYVVKISAGLGALAESEIEMIWESGFFDFGFKRVRKRIRQVRVEFERSEATGTMTYSYYRNGSATKTDVSIAFATYASPGYWVYRFPLSSCYAVNWKHRLYNNDDDALTIKKITYLFSVEPMYQGGGF